MKNTTKVINIRLSEKRVPCINVTPLIQNNAFWLFASVPPDPTGGGLLYEMLVRAVALLPLSSAAGLILHTPQRG
ncbi:MAG: hypothetical protein ACI4IS_05055 [Acutalibacteraceae bacterium]